MIPSSTPSSAIDRALPYRVRADVISVRVDYSGQSTTVLKDPVTLDLFHLTAEEHFLFEKLQRPTSLRQLQKQFEDFFLPRRVSIETLQSYVDRLHDHGLLLSEMPGQANQLLSRRARRRKAWWLSRARGLLVMRLPGIDVSRYLGWPFFDGLRPRCSWLFSRKMLLLVSLIIVGAILALVSQADKFIDELPTLAQLMNAGTLFPLLASLIAVKLLHEWSHAFVCKYFGGKPYEMGLMLLALMPVFYCDVSDAWRFKNKWHRMAVSAAGLGIEIILASLAALLWAVTEPGWLHACALNIVVVCSLGTLLMNANPLLRYDGYYLLEDWLEVPNLSGRGHQWLSSLWQRWLLDDKRSYDTLLSPAKQRLVAAYAIGSRLYLAVVIAGLYLLFLTLARPYHLENLVHSLFAVVLAGILVPVAYSWGKWFLNPSIRRRIQKKRLALSLAMMAGVGAILLGWPVRRQVRGPLLLVPRATVPLFASEEGVLEMALPPGTHVAKGDVVARLSNSQLEEELAKLSDRCQAIQLRREQLLVMRIWDDRLTQQLPTIEANLEDAKVQLAQLEKRADRLILRAPRDGQVLAHIMREPLSTNRVRAKDKNLSTWSGSLLDPHNLGAWVEAGTLVLAIANPLQLEAWVAIPQSEVAQVASEQPVRLVLESEPCKVLGGKVTEVAQRATHTTLDSPSPGSLVEKDLSYHFVQVQLQQDTHANSTPLANGVRGRAKIETSTTTFSAILHRMLRATFQLPW